MCDDPNHFYVTLFSNDSTDLYPSITTARFTTVLPRPIELGSSERWEVGVCEFTYPPNNVGTFKPTLLVDDTTGLIYCDLISPQYVGSVLVRCLRTFIYPDYYSQHIFENVHYMPVEKRTFKNIRIEILQMTGKPVPFKSSKTPSMVVLHFRRASKRLGAFDNI